MRGSDGRQHLCNEPNSLQEKSYLCWLLGLEKYFLCCNLCQVLKQWYSPPFREVRDEVPPPSSLRDWECVLLQKSLCFLLSPLKGVGRVFFNMQVSRHSPSPLSYTGRNEGAPSIECSQKCTTKDWNEETFGFSVKSISFWLCFHSNKSLWSFKFGPKNLDQNRIFY